MSNEKQYLICDSVGNAQIEVFMAESHGSSYKSLKFRGKFQEANTPNKNKRIYKETTLQREVNRLMEAMSERRLVGELDHPSDSVIHYENASHVITNLWWENNVLMGEGEILPTPAGKILEALVQAKIPIGISSRGVGSGTLKPDGIMEIHDNFKLITFDVVADPSTNKAFASPFSESKTESNKNFYIPEKKETKINENRIDTNVLIAYLNSLIKK